MDNERRLAAGMDFLVKQCSGSSQATVRLQFLYTWLPHNTPLLNVGRLSVKTPLKRCDSAVRVLSDVQVGADSLQLSDELVPS